MRHYHTTTLLTSVPLSKMQYWLIKSEPDAYSWNDLVRESVGRWDGVRNYQARNNLKAMRQGDLCLFYHSVSEKSMVGVARVVREHYPDPTAEGSAWVCVDVAPAYALQEPVSLAAIKADVRLANIALLRQSRLSVCPLTQAEFDIILAMGVPKELA